VNSSKKIAVIGGGAAGFFAAINCAAHYPQHQITIYEKSSKLLSKVSVSGGGRCNVTHACFDNKILSTNYPRGQKQLLSAFSRFSTNDTVKWFESRGVMLKTEKDGRLFPVSDDSQTIIDCFLHEANKLQVQVKVKSAVTGISKASDGKINLSFMDDQTLAVDAVLIASGGSPYEQGFNWLKDLGHEIIPPVPSLFTFNIPDNPVKRLMGVSVDHAKVKIIGTNLSEDGPVLITHWGMSGPAILKLSSRAARILAEKNYRFTIRLTWLPELQEDELREQLNELKRSSRKLIRVQSPFVLPKRLWEYFLQKIKISDELQWANLSKEQLVQLIRVLLYDEYVVSGKTTFKEEFVTCGGLALNEVDFKTMESKKVKGIYFAGEILDIDALTGGFNFQAAWTTGFIAGMAMGSM